MLPRSLPHFSTGCKYLLELLASDYVRLMKFKAFIVFGIGFLGIAAVISLVVLYAGGAKPENDPLDASFVLARVNDTDITAGMVNKYLGPLQEDVASDPNELRKRQKDILDELIRLQLYREEAQHRHIVITDAQVDRELVRQYELHGEDELKSLLEERSLTVDDLRQEIRDSFLRLILEEEIRKELESNLTITEEEMGDYYLENKEKYNISDVAHIYLKIPHPAGEAEIQQVVKQAEKIISILNSGSDFSRVARQYSEDASTKNRGGFLGPINSGIFSSSFLNAAVYLAVGEYTKTPIQIQDGIHIIKRLNIKYLDLQEVKEEIRQSLFISKLESAFQDYIAGLKDDAEIKIFI